jgi:DNA invertase Pin-like site-specific DNA recombinase
MLSFLFLFPGRSADPESTLMKLENNMDLLKMLADLRHEREQIEEAIVTLERLARGRGKRRGRPPAWMNAIKRRGRPPGSKNKVKESAAA